MTVTPLRPAFTIGGSTIGAVCGVNPYRSALSVSAEMLGLIEPRGDTEATRMGQFMEPVIARLATTRGFEVLPAPAEGLVGKPKWMTGHPDGFTVVDGERAVLELKNVGANVARTWDEHEPDYVTTQCYWYCHLTGLRRYRVVALLGGTRLGVYTGELDETALGYMIAQGEAFLELVRAGKLAESDGSDDAHATVRLLHPEAQPGKLIRADRETWALVKELRARRQQRETVKRQDAELQQRIEAYMGDAEHLISPHDEEVAHYSNVQSRRIDTTAFKAAHPAVADEFTKVTTTRRFTLL